MKKKVMALVLSALMVTGLVGCGNNNDNSADSKESTLKVGMITDSGTIDDKSFNQGTWEGIIEAEEKLGIEKNYLKPSGETEADYLTEIQNLYDSGYKFIVGPGFKLETAIYKAQEKYQDAKFVILDGAPMDEDGNYVVADNTVAISVDDIMEHSTVTTYGASMEGSYESEKYDAGLPGYTFQIIFDWKAAVNSSGDYIFDKITNAKVTTYKNDIICAMTWGYSSYKVTKNTYSISSNKKSITFNTTYDFEYIMKDDPLAHIYNSTESHTYTIQLNDII